MSEWTSLLELTITKVAPVIGPGAIGAVTALASNWFLEGRKRKHERTALACALAAEMEEGLAMTERRQYEQLFRNYVTQLQAGVNVAVPHLVEVEADPIFTANMSKIGILGPKMAAAVVKYQSISVGIRKDMEALAAMPAPASVAANQTQIAQKLHLIQEDLGLWDEAKRTAVDTIRRLRE